MSRPTFAEIDLNALENNWNLIREIQQLDKIIPVIKANAYGHGDIQIAKKLQEMGAMQCAVAMVEEAENVRKSNFSGRIYTLGPFSKNEVDLLKNLRCTPIVVEKQNLLDLVAEKFHDPIHIKWDTGMNRLGLKFNEISWLQDFIKSNPQINIQAFCTHFLKATDFLEASGCCSIQIEEFQRIEQNFPQITEKHIFNTDSFFANKEQNKLPQSYGARIGLALYGYSEMKNSWALRLKPVMKLKSKVSHLTKVPVGQSVSYNASWVAKQDSLIATLPIGYADGYPRSLSNKGQVFIKGHIVPLVGIVCMDYLMIDVTNVNNVCIGDEVELWGDHLSLKKLADSAGTIVYELLTSLTSRVPRRIISD